MVHSVKPPSSSLISTLIFALLCFLSMNSTLVIGARLLAPANNYKNLPTYESKLPYASTGGTNATRVSNREGKRQEGLEGDVMHKKETQTKSENEYSPGKHVTKQSSTTVLPLGHKHAKSSSSGFRHSLDDYPTPYDQPPYYDAPPTYDPGYDPDYDSSPYSPPL